MTDDRLIGTHVYDSDDDDPDLARVVALPEKRADEWSIGDEQTCSDHPSNEGYPDDAPIAVVVFEDALADAGLADWSGDNPLDLEQLADQGVRYYAFPIGRLVLLPDDEGVWA